MWRRRRQLARRDRRCAVRTATARSRRSSSRFDIDADSGYGRDGSLIPLPSCTVIGTSGADRDHRHDWQRRHLRPRRQRHDHRRRWSRLRSTAPTATTGSPAASAAICCSASRQRPARRRRRPDRIGGGAGNDRIEAGNGNDLASGGSGNDAVGGEAGPIGCAAAGNDRLNGGPGRDRLDGGAGTTSCVASPATTVCRRERTRPSRRWQRTRPACGRIRQRPPRGRATPAATAPTGVPEGAVWWRIAATAFARRDDQAALTGGRPSTVRALGSIADRARRGGSGALSPAIRSSGAEFLFKGSAFGVSTPVEGVDGRVPCGERSRTRSGPEGSSLKRSRSCVADQPGRSQRMAGTPEGPFSTIGARSILTSSADLQVRPA